MQAQSADPALAISPADWGKNWGIYCEAQRYKIIKLMKAPLAWK